MKLTKYNLGCGTDIRKGFINIDNVYIEEVKGQYVKGDITTFNYKKTDLFFLDNILEHFTFEDGSKLLKRLKKYLNPNGKVIIIVPDFEHLSKVINLISPNTLFMFNGWLKNCLLGTQINLEDYHKSFYTQQILKYVCELSGYTVNSMYLLPYEKHGGYHIKIILEDNNVQRK